MFKRQAIAIQSDIILMYKSYELTERKNNQFGTPLISQEPVEVIMPNYLRTCTDVVCLIMLILVIVGFAGLMIYGLASGDPLAVIAIYNSNQTRCNNNSQFSFGYLIDSTQVKNAVCVSECPLTANIVTPCLTDNVNCIGGTFTPLYTSFALDSYCIPDQIGSNINIESIFNFNSFEEWAYDLREGWLVLLASAFAAIILSLLFFVFVRLCTGPIIWIAIILGVLGMMTVGVFFILEAKGIVVSTFISNNLSRFSYDTLIIAGGCLIGGSVLLAILATCLRSRISMGAKAVELGAMFLLQNCFLVILPITQGILILGAFGGLIAGAIALYSLGDFSFTDNAAIPDISLQPAEIAMVTIFIVVGLWLIFFLNGCNIFMLCSAVSVWYFNNVNGGHGAPCGDSLWRLIRFHTGSVVFASLVNGFFWIIKFLANLFSFDTKDDESGIVTCCLKCLNFLFCIFRIFLRYLNDGAYVQMSVNGSGYCSSAFKAFDIIADNALKISITDGISIFFTILGVIGITIGVAIGSYFAVLQMPYFQQRIASPLVTTFVSAVIAFVISCVYLSMIDTASSAVLQCYLIDHERGNGKIRYANERVREIMTYD